MQDVQTRDKKYIENLKKTIARLKAKRNATLLVHNYQREEVQDVADFIGDSLELSRAATKAQADTIVFCGVHFMAESAAILNPEKTVLLPCKEAGCPMADMVTAEKLRLKKREQPDAAVVCYVNSSAAVKAESDICCTSSNAIKVVNSLNGHKRVVFLPDRNLAKYVQQNCPDKEIIPWQGFCITHLRITEEEVLKAKSEHPDAEFLAHPECEPEVQALADAICSTGQMFTYVKNSPKRKFIIGTERGLIYRLQKENPDKMFILPSEHLVCANMKLITLGWVAHALESMTHVITVPEEVRLRAKGALDRMLAVK